MLLLDVPLLTGVGALNSENIPAFRRTNSVRGFGLQKYIFRLRELLTILYAAKKAKGAYPWPFSLTLC